jgi:hypothetical protein
MGTRWMGLLAPIGIPTGDGRRFAKNAVSHRALPLGLKWQRLDEQGHDASVIVGSVDTFNIGTVAKAIEKGWITPEAIANSGLEDSTLGAWGAGELFDDIDPAEMPRLAEDVAEAKLLTSRQVIGPSVDAGMAEVIYCEPGSEEPISEERWEEILDEAWESGVEPEIEAVFTTYEVAAATLVSVPAFAQCLPFVMEEVADSAEGDEGTEGNDDTSAATTERAAALVAAAGPYGDISWFADPELPGVTAITVTDPDEHGYRRVFGHVAAFGVCHVGIRDSCTTAPLTSQQYQPFHRYTRAGQHDLPVACGRITVAHGSLTGACSCCRGIDDHACNNLSMGQTIAHYDRARTVAYTRAGEDAFGIWVAGVIAPDATDDDIAALRDRQKVSGDWRDVAGSLELVEVLTLNREKPGFPLPHAAMNGGRPVSLVAAGTVSTSRTGRPARPAQTARRGRTESFDYERVGTAVAAALAPLLAGAGAAPINHPPAPAPEPEPELEPVPAGDPEFIEAFTAASRNLEAVFAEHEMQEALADV